MHKRRQLGQVGMAPCKGDQIGMVSQSVTSFATCSALAVQGAHVRSTCVQLWQPGTQDAAGLRPLDLSCPICEVKARNHTTWQARVVLTSNSVIWGEASPPRYNEWSLPTVMPSFLGSHPASVCKHAGAAIVQYSEALKKATIHGHADLHQPCLTLRSSNLGCKSAHHGVAVHQPA